MKINELYLDDLKRLDLFAKSCKDVYTFIYDLKAILKIKYKCNYESENIEELMKVNNILGLDNEGCIHALLLNLFLRGKNKITKDFVKDKISLTSIDYVNDEFQNEISGKLSIDRSILDDMMSIYYQSLDNEYEINEEDIDCINSINQYYGDEAKRIQKIADSISDELRKIGL